ncbi:hypothetical protein EON64_12415, partial [archaeon]
TRHYQGVKEAVQSLRSEGYQIVVLETTTMSQPYSQVHHTPYTIHHTSSIPYTMHSYLQVRYPGKLAIVLGNELTGVDSLVIERADVVAQIPTYGLKNSLNVASVAPVIVFEVLRQWNAQPNKEAERDRIE